MEVKKDFIEREIQKLTLLLIDLIDKIKGLNSNNAESGIQETNKVLKSEFDLTLREIIQMENSELLKYITDLHELHIEKLTELIYEVVRKIYLSDSELSKKQEKEKLVQKSILLLNYLDEKSNIFSIKRMELKNALQAL